MEPPDPPPPPLPPPPPRRTRKRGRRAAKSDEPSQEAAPPHEPSRPPLVWGKRRSRTLRLPDEDCISRLPDDLLGTIISLLPTKEGGKTQTLAKRWRPLWCAAAPLHLDISDLAVSDQEDLARLVSRILLAHEAAPGRRFCVPVQHIHDRPAIVEGWLRSPALNNLEELEFLVPKSFYGGPLLPPPPSTFRCSATLRVAAISECCLPDCTALALKLPQLRQLTLHQVQISEISLHSIIAGSPALDCLLLKRCYGLRCLRINSPSIRSIGFHSACCGRRCMEEGHHLEDVIIEYAPCLERLLHIQRPFGLGVRLAVIVAPKLETLGCVDGFDVNYSGLNFSTVVFKGLKVNFTTPVSSVKILAVTMGHLSLDKVIDLLRCFPCLEKLYITALHYQITNLWRRKHRNLVRSLDLCLKTVVLDDYHGNKSQVNFATFFVVNATKLENMIFMGGLNNDNEFFIERQHRLLELEGRASRGAQFRFTSKRCLYHLVHIRNIRDLCLSDPFECTC